MPCEMPYAQRHGAARECGGGRSWSGLHCSADRGIDDGERRYPAHIDRPPTLMIDASARLALNRSRQPPLILPACPIGPIDVIEVDTIPALEAVWPGLVCHRRNDARRIGARIFEVPEDRDLFERRDPYGRYKASRAQGQCRTRCWPWPSTVGVMRQRSVPPVMVRA